MIDETVAEGVAPSTPTTAASTTAVPITPAAGVSSSAPHLLDQDFVDQTHGNHQQLVSMNGNLHRSLEAQMSGFQTAVMAQLMTINQNLCR